MNTQDARVELVDNELFDDEGLAATVAAITGRGPEAADEFTMYVLLIMDGLGTQAPPSVTQVLQRSVELAFQFTETFKAALDFYTLGQRGMIRGKGSPVEIIRGLVESRGQPTCPGV